MGFDDVTTGVFLGASIHDVAHVVGAGCSVSSEAGNVALIVKLFRVFLLLPVVLGVGWYFDRSDSNVLRARVPVPIFALMFLMSVSLNSLGVLPNDIKEWLLWASRWGLLLALSALGLNTSLDVMCRVGWRPFLLVAMTSVVVFLIPAIWLSVSH